MNFLNLLWSILHNLFTMMFHFDSSNPFIYLSALVIVSIITLGITLKIFKHK